MFLPNLFDQEEVKITGMPEDLSDSKMIFCVSFPGDDCKTQSGSNPLQTTVRGSTNAVSTPAYSVCPLSVWSLCAPTPIVHTHSSFLLALETGCCYISQAYLELMLRAMEVTGVHTGLHYHVQNNTWSSYHKAWYKVASYAEVNSWPCPIPGLSQQICSGHSCPCWKARR